MKSVPAERVMPMFPGYLYVPDTPGPHPGILFLHGSEGGNGDFFKLPGEDPLPRGEAGYMAKMAKHYAKNGFVTYAYSYFHAEKTEEFSSYPPTELVNIELKNTALALKWLKESSYVQGRSVGIWGGSRGAEHALILASLVSVESELSDIGVSPDLIIADAPSDFIYPGLSIEGANAISAGTAFPEQLPSAWNINGKSIEMYSPVMIEKIRAPILITYGAKDEVWGPYVEVEKLHKRLLNNGIRSQHFDFYNLNDPVLFMHSLYKYLIDDESVPHAFFIRFMDEGHNPRPNTNSSRLQSMIAEMLIKKYLSR